MAEPAVLGPPATVADPPGASGQMPAIEQQTFAAVLVGDVSVIVRTLVPDLSDPPDGNGGVLYLEAVCSTSPRTS
ncbi:hypothetical protein AB0H12_30100 [Actinosynnema sp. NPDC023794]